MLTMTRPKPDTRDGRMLAILEAANGEWVTSGELAEHHILSASQGFQRLRDRGYPVESPGRGGMGRYRLVASGRLFD